MISHTTTTSGRQILTQGAIAPGHSSSAGTFTASAASSGSVSVPTFSPPLNAMQAPLMNPLPVYSPVSYYPGPAAPPHSPLLPFHLQFGHQLQQMQLQAQLQAHQLAQMQMMQQMAIAASRGGLESEAQQLALASAPASASGSPIPQLQHGAPNAINAVPSAIAPAVANAGPGASVSTPPTATGTQSNAADSQVKSRPVAPESVNALIGALLQSMNNAKYGPAPSPNAAQPVTSVAIATQAHVVRERGVSTCCPPSASFAALPLHRTSSPYAPKVTTACNHCKAAKTKCDFSRPCKRCCRIGTSGSCCDAIRKPANRRRVNTEGAEQ